MEDKSELYLAYFDSLGFECVINLSAHEKRAMWNVLADKEPDRLPVHMMIMRAKANPQRFPEIWTFWSSVPRKQLLEYATESPQTLADSIRRIGTKVFVTLREKELIK
jgi:hypothetical protein